MVDELIFFSSHFLFMFASNFSWFFSSFSFIFYLLYLNIQIDINFNFFFFTFFCCTTLLFDHAYININFGYQKKIFGKHFLHKIYIFRLLIKHDCLINYLGRKKKKYKFRSRDYSYWQFESIQQGKRLCAAITKKRQ